MGAVEQSGWSGRTPEAVAQTWRTTVAVTPSASAPAALAQGECGDAQLGQVFGVGQVVSWRLSRRSQTDLTQFQHSANPMRVLTTIPSSLLTGIAARCMICVQACGWQAVLQWAV